MPARKALEQALVIDRELGYKEEESETNLELAELDIEDGRATEAQTLLQESLKEFRKAKLSDDEISAHALLARALVAAGKPADALKEVDCVIETRLLQQNACRANERCWKQGLLTCFAGDSLGLFKPLRCSGQVPGV